jgi:hypothetical protein
MSILKRSIVSLAWAGLVVTGLGVFSSDAEAFHCRRSFIPFGYHPTGVSCSQVCESERYVSQNGLSTICVIYGPGLPF